ncbi:MAG: methionine adenosyltransferase [Prevotellaceae bacterium]|jgi:S-adenosylmethionine synthetase|nr:methionine adenosyltransferase [Prevotellaceae bacterium]
MAYLFTSESVSSGHPDKIADQISDAILDQFLAFDENSKVACETFVTTGQVVVGGEVKSQAYVDIQTTVRKVINNIGYNRSEYMFDGNSCGILSAIHEQSPDINRGVDRSNVEEQGAGDQGMMFGYATNETPDFLPLSLDISHEILFQLEQIRKEGKVMKYLRPDAKSQVTIEYGDNDYPQRIHTIVVSTQHDEFDTDQKMLQTIKNDVKTILLPKVFNENSLFAKYLDSNVILYVNPTGKFVIGGPHGDTGLTGRKIIVDTYGGKGAHGGGAFSGKDPSKVDRSAAYAARHIAKNMVAAGIADEILVQISYAIGIAEPVSIYVSTFGKSKVQLSDAQISEKIKSIFDLRPFAIEKRLKLRNPIYLETASFGHVGRKPRTVSKVFSSPYEEDKQIEVELFTWEKLDYVEQLRQAFGITGQV